MPRPTELQQLLRNLALRSWRLPTAATQQTRNRLLSTHRPFTNSAPRRRTSKTTSTTLITASSIPAFSKTQLVTGILLLATTVGAVRFYTKNNSNMSSSLIPANPSAVMVIRDVTPNVVTLSVPFLRFGKIPVGGRGTIVRLTSGALAVFSPVALTPEVKAKVESLGGNVQYLIAPDMEHHIFISDWAKAYPAAKLIGPDGLPEKRKGMTDEKIGKEEFAVVYKADTKRQTSVSAEFDADFEVEYVDGHANKEIVLFYKPEGVLIEADLMFNLPPTEQYSRVPEAERPKPGLLAKFFSSAQTVEGKGQKRLLWHAISRGNRLSFNESVQRIDKWDIKTIVPCHGDVIEKNAKGVFEYVFEWHLNGHK